MNLNDTEIKVLANRVADLNTGKLAYILHRSLFAIETYDLENDEAAKRVAANRWSKAEISRFAAWVNFCKDDMADYSWVFEMNDWTLTSLLIQWVIWQRPRSQRRTA